MSQSSQFLPYGRQSVSDDDIEAVVTVLRGDYLTTGPEIERFENAFAHSVSAPYAVSCNSATAALHLALDGLGVGPGDVCIVPTITFLATANAVRYCGGEVVFADVDPGTGLLTPETFTAALERCARSPKAVLPVHLAGAVCDMPSLCDLARSHDMVIVEDACHALAGTAHGQPVGACQFSDAATFSFHPVKTLACGEGGMVTTQNAALAAHMKQTRSHGVRRDSAQFEATNGANEPWWYEMQSLGWNYRLPDINAALGRSQLKRLAEFAARRRTLASLYREHLSELSPIVQTPAEQDGIDPCRHLFNVSIDFDQAGVARQDVMTTLHEHGIGTQVHYIPVHTQPYYRHRYGDVSLPGAQAYYARTLSLPLYPAMRDDDPQRVTKALKAALKL